jgi:hypothetical protein
MRQLSTGLVAAVAVMAAAPAFACGYNPCAAPVYVAPAPVVNYGCNPCGGVSYGYSYERLAAPEQQYYYVNQGPTYSGPGNFAPARVYEEGSVSGYGYARPHYGYRHHYGYRPHYGYQPHYGYRHYGTYAPRASYYHAPRVGYYHGYASHRAYAPYYGHHALRRYY